MSLSFRSLYVAYSEATLQGSTKPITTQVPAAFTKIGVRFGSVTRFSNFKAQYRRIGSHCRSWDSLSPDVLDSMLGLTSKVPS
jgi:hypothetical protein